MCLSSQEKSSERQQHGGLRSRRAIEAAPSLHRPPIVRMAGVEEQEKTASIRKKALLPGSGGRPDVVTNKTEGRWTKKVGRVVSVYSERKRREESFLFPHHFLLRGLYRMLSSVLP